MANKTLAQLRALVRSSHHEFSAANGLTDTEVNYAINESLEHIIDEIFRFNEYYMFARTTMSLISGQNYIELPVGFSTLRGLIYTASGAPVKIVDRYDQLTNYSGTMAVAEGDLRVWIPNDKLIVFDRTPSASKSGFLTMDYDLGHVTLDDDTDQMALADKWQYAVVNYARYLLFLKLSLPWQDARLAYEDFMQRKLDKIRRPISGARR